MVITSNTTLVKPGPIGRIGRLLVGALSISFVTGFLPYYTYFISASPIDGGSPYLIGVLIAFLVFNDVINIGFNVSWGRWPQAFFIGLILSGISLDVLIYGTAWEQPVGIILLLLTSFTHLYLGTSHILAALIGTPGYEMRALPHLAAKLGGRDIEEVVCPGH